MAVHLLLDAIKKFRDDICAQRLCEGPAAAINESDCNGTTPLILAARLNNESALQLLLSHGADATAAEVAEVGSNTALHYAARNKNEAMVGHLLSHGASPNKQNGLGQTPLHIAARVGCVNAAEQMLSKGANPAITDDAGFDAAYWAQHMKHSDLAQLLPPPKALNSKDLALFQVLAMDQLNLTLKFPPKKKGAGGKGKKKK